MDFGVVVGVLLRRWLVGLIGLLLAAGAAVAVYRATPRTYQTSSQVMVLLPPTAGSAVVESSPFLYLPSGLTTLARIVALTPGTEEFRRAMHEDGFADQFEVSVESQTPIVRFTVEGSEPAGVLKTRDELMRRYGAELEHVQREERVPERQFAHVRTLEASREVQAVSGDRVRAAGVTGVLLVVLTLLAMVVVDRIAAASARRRASVLADPIASTPVGAAGADQVAHDDGEFGEAPTSDFDEDLASAGGAADPVSAGTNLEHPVHDHSAASPPARKAKRRSGVSAASLADAAPTESGRTGGDDADDRDADRPPASP